MSRLHNGEAGVGDYNIEVVRNDDIRIDAGIVALDKLYIPINADNTQWDFISTSRNVRKKYPAI
jgi:hypothetical protein